MMFWNTSLSNAHVFTSVIALRKQNKTKQNNNKSAMFPYDRVADITLSGHGTKYTSIFKLPKDKFLNLQHLMQSDF